MDYSRECRWEDDAPLSDDNLSVKTSMARELSTIGLSRAAIGRVLHVSARDIEAMMKERNRPEE